MGSVVGPDELRKNAGQPEDGETGSEGRGGAPRQRHGGLLGQRHGQRARGRHAQIDARGQLVLDEVDVPFLLQRHILEGDEPLVRLELESLEVLVVLERRLEQREALDLRRHPHERRPHAPHLLGVVHHVEPGVLRRLAVEGLDDHLHAGHGGDGAGLSSRVPKRVGNGSQRPR